MLPLLLLGAFVVLGLSLTKAQGGNVHIPGNCLTCNTKFMPAFRKQGQRSPSQISLVVLHSTEGDPKNGKLPTAAGVASYFQSPTAGGSTQLIVDETSCYRSLPDTTIPVGAAGGNANSRGVHIEMVGWAHWSRTEWLSHVATLDCAADKVAKWCLLYHIPPVSLTDTELGENDKGITTHAQVTRVYNIVAGHTDPGAGFPMDVFVDKVKTRMGQLQSSGETLVS